jgi:xanthine dehydrogenase small subunit
MTTRPLRFVHQGRIVEISRFDPMTTVLDWLRLEKRLTGTKEGCGEGDCGACTVALGRVRDGRLHYEPVNACILLLGQIDGAELVTVEDLAASSHLHPVQQALVDHHGSQCGFCTPGFVMSLFTLYQDGTAVERDREAVLTRIAGNLCRCTGYRPIVDAALEACSQPAGDRFSAEAGDKAALLDGLADEVDLFAGDDRSFFAAPASLDALCSLMERHQDATMIGGATDVGLWITKQLRTLPKIVHTGRVPDLKRLETSAAGDLSIGAAVTYAEARAALAGFDSDIGIWADRLGSAQVRATGTIGGNIANGSPIGDSPPLLIALGATLHLRRGESTRSLPLEDFFLSYGRQDRAPDEVITRVVVPKPAVGTHVRVFKIAKRHDQDISSVMGALAIRPADRRIESARIAFGGMAGVPKRARTVETRLQGLSLDDETALEQAVGEIAADFTPMDDHRASARYRLTVAGNLIRKGLMEIATGDRNDTRIAHLREADDAA